STVAVPNPDRVVELVALFIAQDEYADIPAIDKVGGKYVLYDHIVRKGDRRDGGDQGPVEPDRLLTDLDVEPGDVPGRNIGIEQRASAAAAFLIPWRLVELQRE